MNVSHVMQDTPLKDQFAVIFERESDALFRFCLWRTSERELAVEFAQEAMARLWQEMVRGKEIPNPRAFLFLVAKRLVIDWYRKKRPFSLDKVFDDGDPALEPRDEKAAAEVEELSDGRRALELLDRVDPQYREVLYLRFVEDLPPRDIALALKLTPNAVSVRITRGLSELRAVIMGTKE